MAPEDSTNDPRIAAAVGGDTDALQELLAESVPWLAPKLSIASKWSRAISREDVIQVTFLEAYLRIRTLREPKFASFRAWLARIAENNLRDAIRDLGRDKRPESRGRLTSGADGESSRTLLARMQSDGTSLESRLDAAAEIERLHAAIGELPESYAFVVRAYDLEERSVAEIAAELGRSPGAIHMLHSRALDRLRELLARASA